MFLVVQTAADERNKIVGNYERISRPKAASHVFVVMGSVCTHSLLGILHNTAAALSYKLNASDSTFAKDPGFSSFTRVEYVQCDT